LTDRSFHERIYGILSAHFLDERYKISDHGYQEAIQTAKDLWEKGDLRYHHEMARDLIKEERFSKLNQEKLKKMLLPIAAHFKRDYVGAHMKKPQH